MQHCAFGRPQLSRQFPPHPFGVQQVPDCEHSALPVHAHDTICPQLSTRCTLHALPQTSVGVQHDSW
jgi:hypothetical protein